MAEAKKKQAHTNKDKDADKNTEAVHDGTAIVRYTHHTCIHTSKHKHIQTYKHTYIHTYKHMYLYMYMHICMIICDYANMNVLIHKFMYTYMSSYIHGLERPCAHVFINNIYIYIYT